MTLLSSRVHQVFPGPVAEKFDALLSLGSAGAAIEFVVGLVQPQFVESYRRELCDLAMRDDAITELLVQIRAARKSKANGYQSRIRELRRRIRAIEGK